MALRHHPDGKAIACGLDAPPDRKPDKGAVRIFSPDGSSEPRDLAGHEERVYSLAFTPDGKRLLAVDGSCVRVWDVAKAKQLFQLTGHERPIGAIAVTQDGKAIASAAEDATIRLWDAKTGKETARFSDPEITVIRASPSARMGSFWPPRAKTWRNGRFSCGTCRVAKS